MDVGILCATRLAPPLYDARFSTDSIRRVEAVKILAQIRANDAKLPSDEISVSQCAQELDPGLAPLVEGKPSRGDCSHYQNNVVYAEYFRFQVHQLLHGKFQSEVSDESAGK